jgi:cytochrome P450
MSLAEFNLFDPAHIECPYPFYEALHREAPVYEVHGLGIFLVTRYDDVVEMLRDPATFSSAFNAPDSPASMLAGPETDELRAIRARGWPIVDTMLTCDPPAHDRYRALVSTVFTPRKVAAREAEIAQVADDLVDGFIDDGQVELVSQFAVGLPLIVIADALGVPRDDLDAFKKWSDDSVRPIGSVLSPDQQEEVARSIVEFQHYFAARIDERRAAPRDDLLSDLVAARIEGEAPLDTPELLSILQQLLVAGNETTTKLIGSGMLLLLQQPDTMARLVAEPALIPAFVEEVLRLEAPLQGMFRIATRDAVLGGVEVPARALLIAMFGAANRDDAQFEDAAVLDLDRANARTNLAFGNGIHFCIGAALARAEARIGFETLLSRLVDIRLADGVTFDDLTYEPSFLLRGLTALPLTFRKGSA